MNTFGFSYNDSHLVPVCLYAIGEEVHTANYFWSGNNRPDINTVLFQYTLSGAGILEYENERHHLGPGDAFLVKIPSDHTYYLPKTSTSWRFIYITLSGEFALNAINTLAENQRVLSVHPKSRVINQLKYTLSLAKRGQLHTVFQASKESYVFLMELMHFLTTLEKPNMPFVIQQALDLMHTQFHKDLDLSILHQASGLSMYHFSRLFKYYTKKTPIDYLTSVRMQQAMDLLANTTLPIADIAHKVGYKNGNYFAKVFKKQNNLAPSIYRTGKQAFHERTWTFH